MKEKKKFCGKCGNALSDSEYCVRCGYNNTNPEIYEEVKNNITEDNKPVPTSAVIILGISSILSAIGILGVLLEFLGIIFGDLFIMNYNSHINIITSIILPIISATPLYFAVDNYKNKGTKNIQTIVIHIVIYILVYILSNIFK